MQKVIAAANAAQSYNSNQQHPLSSSTNSIFARRKATMARNVSQRELERDLRRSASDNLLRNKLSESQSVKKSNNDDDEFDSARSTTSTIHRGDSLM